MVRRECGNILNRDWLGIIFPYTLLTTSRSHSLAKPLYFYGLHYKGCQKTSSTYRNGGSFSNSGDMLGTTVPIAGILCFFSTGI